jgi:serine/threonine protein kinase
MDKADYKLPRLYGKYFLLELINVGGMAEVFKAKMFGVEGFEKIVAIKKILPEIAEDKEFIRMFVDEAKIAVRLQHPNIVQILELGKIEESYFIAMELVNGKDLKTIRKRMKRVDLLMPPEQSSFAISQVCDGLDYAHRKCDEKMNSLNIVHRDISPQNIIISYEGTVKLIDFGIAKAKSKSTKTQAGMLKGKFSYMSPEQVSGQPIDRRSDIFSLGVVFFEMLTGKRLFLGKNDVETLEKIRKAEVPPPSVFNSLVPPELDRIVLKALAKDRDERYQWASEFAEDLKKFSYTTDQQFSRQDMMNFMSEFFADELEEETAKLEEYEKIKKPSDAEYERTYSPAPKPGTKTQTRGYTEDSDEIEIESISSNPLKKIALFLAVVSIIGSAIFAGIYLMDMQSDSVTILLDSSVDKTNVVLNQDTVYQKQCETPCRMEGVKSGTHQLVFRKEGYIEQHKNINLSKDQKNHRELVQMLKIGEKVGMMMVISDPEGADIFINGERTGKKTPSVIDKVPVGVEVAVSVEKQGYETSEQKIGPILSGAGTSQTINFYLREQKRGRSARTPSRTATSSSSGGASASQAQAAEGFISINSRPWTNVYINGKFIKATPIIRHSLRPGKHKIQFKNKQFGIDKTFPIDIKSGDHQRMIQNF